MKKFSLLLIAIFVLTATLVKAQLSINIDSVQNVGSCTFGQIFCSASGGVAPYTFSKDGTSGVIGVFTVTSPGVYIVVASDSIGNTDTAFVTVGGSSSIMNVTLTGTPNNLCSINCDTAIINVVGGTAPYTYASQGQTMTGNTSVVCNLASTTVYTFVVTDANGCQAVATKVIQAATANQMSFSSTLVHPTCGNANGKIIASLLGGVTPINYTLNGVAGTMPFSNLSPGTYTVAGTSATGCSRTITLNLSNQNALLITSAKVNPTCLQTNGSITMTPYNGSGTGPYTYSWSNGDTTQTVTGLAAGTYSCTVTDALGCSKSSVATLTVNSTLFATSSKINPTCGGGLGSIKMLPYNGTPPYTYLWSNGATTDSIGGLAAGTYTCTITDSVGCTRVMTNSLVVVNNMFVTSIVNNTICTSNSGSITYIVSGGISPYTYSFNGAAANTSNIFTNLSAGFYTLVATDAAGCTKSTSANVLITNPLGLNTLAIQNSCNGNNGAIQVAPTNGLPPYNYVWNITPAQNTDSVYGLANGVYNVSVSDANGCNKVDSFIIQTIDMMANVTSPSICSGDSTSINISIQNSNSIMPSGYAPSTAISNLDEDIVSFSIGSFTQTSICGSSNGAVNANGFAPSVLNKYSNYTNISAGAYAPGSIVPYTLKYSACGTFGYSTGYSIFIDVNRNGILEPTEKVGGSTSLTAAAIAPQMTTATGNITIPINITPGATLLRVVLQESNANPNPTGNYQWGETEDYKIILGNVLTVNSTIYPTSSVLSVIDNHAIVAPTTTTTYTIVNTDPQLCNDTAYATVTVNNTLVNNTITTLASDVDCPLSTDGQIAVVATPVSNALTYSWSHGDSAGIAANLPVGNYKVTVYDSLGGCQVLMDTIVSLGINCGNVGGVVKHDADDDCIVNSTENPIPNTMITANPGNHITYSDAMGNYSFAGLPYGTYTVTHGNNLPSFVNNCAPSVTTVLDSINFASLVDFADSNKLIYDYRIYSSNGCIAPALGQTKRNIYINHNQANITSSVTAYVVFDSIALYKSSVPTHSSINGDTVFWNLNVTGNYNYQTNGGKIILELDVDSATQMGIVYSIIAGIKNTQYADTVLHNNKHTYTLTTCTSYDPNDKSVTPMGKTALGYIPVAASQKDYIINFQNTGNFTAGRVIIMDTLSANLDITSFQVIGASHPYHLQVIDNHILKIAFLNIMLPDSGTNLEGSKGHIAFSIKHNANLVSGNSILNKAAIYFDFNPSIITNTVINTLYDPFASSNTTTNNSMCNATCGNGGAIVVNTGGVAPYTTTIAPMCAATIVNGNQITNLPSGSFVITTTDAIGNVVTNTNVVNTTPSNLQIASASITQPAAGVWGAVTVNPVNGVGAYTYNWTPGNMTTAAVSNLTTGTYTCVVTDANGCSTSAVYTIDVPLGVNGLAVNTLKVYPNPTSGNLIIENNLPLGKVQITNAIGVVVKEVLTQNNTISIDVTSLANGMYEIRTSSGITTKFVKQN
jgi:large repetitive protein